MKKKVIDKPTIFIASSGKSKSVAEAIKLNFDKETDVDIWTENIFKLNEGTLETLMNRASYYDFFIAVFAADDVAKINGKKANVTRDNVIFEFGLFLGRIGLNRTFFVLEEGVTLFSDWDGMTVAKFTRRDNLVAALGACCIRIREKMQVAEKLCNYTILPSTALAVGYYNNFLKPILQAFQYEKMIEIVEKDNKGDIISKVEHEIENRHPTIEIRVPKNLTTLDREKLNFQTKDFKQIIIKAQARFFPFYVQGEFTKGANLHLFDIPTTLFASYLTIQEFFSKEFLATENNLQKLNDKEIKNFEMTLSKLIPDDIEHKFYSFTVY